MKTKFSNFSHFCITILFALVSSLANADPMPPVITAVDDIPVDTGVLEPTYSIGPSRTYQQFSDLPTLGPGDVVAVDGGYTYQAVSFSANGSESSPIQVIGVRSQSGDRPVISGGVNTVEFGGDHYVFDGFEVTGGSSRCVFHRADDITVRDAVIHDCPGHGVLGADEGSGSLLLEYCEVYNAGQGIYEHQIYMTTDQIAHPGSTFRMQFCYIHDANGGNSVKSRAERNEIYYNWIEGSAYHELELIGPDPGGTSIAESAYIENSDVVGNVLLKSAGGWIARFGGDGTGQTNGRYRFSHNTVILAPESSGVFRLFTGIASVEAHNNVFYQTGSGSAQILRDAEADWVGGVRRVAGSNNFLVSGTGFSRIPDEWINSVQDSESPFQSLGTSNLQPASGSVLIDAANSSPSSYPGYSFPSPEEAPRYHPPAGSFLTVDTAEPRVVQGSGIDIGAVERMQ